LARAGYGRIFTLNMSGRIKRPQQHISSADG
jgi:cold shock protein